MIFRNLFGLIHIHPIVFLFLFLSFITGTMTQLLILFIIVIIHELGHFMMAHYFRWRIERITIWVFGAVMVTSEYRMRRLHEDLLVTVAGPVQHVLIFLVLLVMQGLEILPVSLIEFAWTYNLILLGFNLLPIYPLDGGKILFYLIAYFIPYREARRFVILFSLWSCLLIVCLQIVLLPFTLTATLLMIFLFIENYFEWRQEHYHFIRFLMGRYYFPDVNSKGKSVIIRKNLNDILLDALRKFYLYRKNFVVVEFYMIKYELSEKACLSLFFLKEKMTQSFGNIMLDKDKQIKKYFN